MVEEALGCPIDCNYIEQISKRTCNFLREYQHQPKQMIPFPTY